MNLINETKGRANKVTKVASKRVHTVKKVVKDEASRVKKGGKEIIDKTQSEINDFKKGQ